KWALGRGAMACQTTTGFAGTSISWVSSNGCAIAGAPLLPSDPFRSLPSARRRVSVGLQARVDGDDHAVLPAPRRIFVVVLADEACDGGRQLVGERGPVGGVREAHLPVHPESRQP